MNDLIILKNRPEEIRINLNKILYVANVSFIYQVTAYDTSDKTYFIDNEWYDENFFNTLEMSEGTPPEGK